jgi:hypothetical protein
MKFIQIAKQIKFKTLRSMIAKNLFFLNIKIFLLNSFNNNNNSSQNWRFLFYYRGYILINNNHLLLLFFNKLKLKITKLKIEIKIIHLINFNE